MDRPIVRKGIRKEYIWFFITGLVLLISVLLVILRDDSTSILVEKDKLTIDSVKDAAFRNCMLAKASIYHTEKDVEKKVILKLELEDFHKVELMPGVKVNCYVYGESFEGIVNKVYPFIENKNLHADLLFEGEELPCFDQGKSPMIKIEIGEPRQAVMIPRGDFYEYTCGEWIYVIDPADGQAGKRKILLGSQNLGFFEVLEGLEPGEMVIVSGYENFADADILIFE